MKEEAIIRMGHGSGGRLSAELIAEVFFKAFGQQSGFPADAALVGSGSGNLAFTTDSYVVDPIFFPGGNIGKLAVCGTVNDLVVSGARPLALSAGFIIEEGFPVKDLKAIAETMAEQAALAGVKIVTGDTKVVPKGKCDRIFINTSGIGAIEPSLMHLREASLCTPGDAIIINGSIGDHSTAVMAARNNISFEPAVNSDCAALNSMLLPLFILGEDLKFMRDATRGGLATVLCELAAGRKLGARISEKDIPVSSQVAGFCEMFGFDPLHMANEGKAVILVSASRTGEALALLKQHPLGASACMIGHLTDAHSGRVVMDTVTGGERIVDMLSGEQLPRIC